MPEQIPQPWPRERSSSCGQLRSSFPSRPNARPVRKKNRQLPYPLRRAPLQEPAPEVSVASVEMGLGVWKSIEGPPPAVIPVGRLGLRLTARSQLRLSVAGLGSLPVVSNVYGTATVSQTMALLELGLALGSDQRIQPLLSLGGGVLNVAVAGTGDTHYEELEIHGNGRQQSTRELVLLWLCRLTCDLDQRSPRAVGLAASGRSFHRHESGDDWISDADVHADTPVRISVAA